MDKPVRILALPILFVLWVLALLELTGFFLAGFLHRMHPERIGPLDVVFWWIENAASPLATERLLRSLECAASVALGLPCLVAFAPEIGRMLERFRGGAENKLHGEARWARAREIRGAGLLGMAGIVLGKKQGRTLFFDGQGRGKNVLIAAPPGSGKTAGIMLPNCLSWPQSLVALDIKGECCALTAAYRESLGQKVVRLNFSARDGRTDQYNPFAYVSEDPDLRVGDIEKIARYLCPDPARGDAFWAMSAREMFRALALYLFDAGKPVTLGAIRDLLETEEGLRRFAKEVLRDRKAEGEKVITARVARDFAIMANRSDATHSGIVDQLMTALAPFANPLLRRATAENSFDLRDLRKDPVSIYLIVARPDLPALRPLLNLFVQQLVDLNTLVEFGKDPEHKSEVLLAMDEFAQVGRLDAIFEGITYFRSFGLRLLAIVQSPAQLKEIYSFEAAEAFEQSFDCRVYFTPAASDIGTAETVSRLLGTNTVSGRSRSIRLGSSRSSSSVTQSEKGRPLLLPQEVLRLPLEKEIVLIGGVAPILADKIRVWKESVFAQRMDAAP